MTQTLETQMERQLNLDYFYEAAKRALSTKDYKQARSLTSSGLEEAKDLNNAHWINLYSEMLSKIPDSKPKKKRKPKNRETLFEKKKDNDLKKIRGIGPKLEETLKEHGIHTIQALASNTSEELSEINGIGPKTAQKMLSNAKDYFQKKNQSKGQIITKDVESKENSTDSPTQNEVEDISYEKEEPKKKLSEVERSQEKPKPTLIKKKDKEDIEEKKESEEKPKKIIVDSLKQAKNTLKSKISLQDIAQKIKPDIKFKKGQAKEEKEKSKSKNKGEIEKAFFVRKIKISSETKKILSLLGYEVINSRKEKLKNYLETDLFAFKEMNTAKNLTTLVIHPIRQLNLKNETKMTSSNQSIVESFSQIRSKIKKDLSKEGPLFHYIKDTYFPNLRVKKTSLKRPLFLNAGKMELNIIIDPIILYSENGGGLEKDNPFSFSKTYALYYSTEEKVDDLLLYLRAKYEALEKINDEETSVEKYVSTSQTFNKLLQYISIPFLMVGIFFSFLLMSPIDEFLLNSLLYPSITLYCVLISYAYLHYKREVKGIYKKYSSSIYDTPVENDQKTLTQLTVELEKPHLEQFLFEFEKKNKKDSFKKSKNGRKETSNQEKKVYKENKDLKKNVPKENLDGFEEDKEFTEDGLKKEVLNRFSFFMED